MSEKFSEWLKSFTLDFAFPIKFENVELFGRTFLSLTFEPRSEPLPALMVSSKEVEKICPIVRKTSYRPLRC